MAYGEVQEVKLCTLFLDEDEGSALRALLANHTERVGLNTNGGPLQRIREALADADVPMGEAYSSRKSRGLASMYATNDEAVTAIRDANLPACHLCGGTAGDLVDVTLYGQPVTLYGKPVSYMHAYGACKTDGFIR